MERRRWGEVTAEVRAGRWADCRAEQEEPGASLEEGREHLLGPGNPEEERIQQS